MAARVLKTFDDVRKAQVIRIANGRACVKVEAPKIKTKSGKLIGGIQFRGCFKSQGQAEDIAEKLSHMRTLPKGKVKAKKSKKRSKR